MTTTEATQDYVQYREYGGRADWNTWWNRYSPDYPATLDCGHADTQPDVAHSSRPDGLDACCEACCWLCSQEKRQPHLVTANTGKDLGPATIQHIAVAELHPWGWVRIDPATLKLDTNGILCWLDDGEPF